MTDTPNLPPFPDRMYFGENGMDFTEAQMRDYALAAYQAGRAAGVAASEERVTQLREALSACQTVAIMRGDRYLCDCIDNTGRRYQSTWLAGLLAAE